MTAKRKKKATLSKQLAVQPARPLAQHELLLIDEVTDRVRLSDTTLWRLEKANRFPKRLKIGFKRVAWPAREIDAWIAIGADAWAASHAVCCVGANQ